MNQNNIFLLETIEGKYRSRFFSIPTKWIARIFSVSKTELDTVDEIQHIYSIHLFFIFALSVTVTSEKKIPPYPAITPELLLG